MRLRVSRGRDPVITISRAVLRNRKLVYIACANKRLRYRFGRSPVVYIGTTRNGASRIAESAAHAAQRIFEEWGIKRLDFYVVSCTARKNVVSWTLLERALLLKFREKFGEVPKLNSHGKNFRPRHETKYFSGSRLTSVIDSFK